MSHTTTVASSGAVIATTAFAKGAVLPIGAAATVPATIGTLSQATPGVTIIRGEATLAAEGTQSLMLGDRIVVPQGAQAALDFPGLGQQGPLNGVLTGGSQATITSTPLPEGIKQVDLDLTSGDMIVAAAGTTATSATAAGAGAATSAGFGLTEFALAGLGAVAVGAVASNSGDDDSNWPLFLAPTTDTPAPTDPTQPAPTDPTQPAPTDPTQPAPTDPTQPAPTDPTQPAPTDPTQPAPTDPTQPAPTDPTQPAPTDPTQPAPTDPTQPAPTDPTQPAPDATDDLHTPVTDLVTDLVNNLPIGPEVGPVIEPVVDLVDDLLDTVGDVTGPLLGDNFTPNNPNALDPLDELGGDLTSGVGEVIAPIVDGLLGDGATQAVVDGVSQQVDYLTDGVVNLVDNLGLGGLGLGDANSPVGSLVDGLLGDEGVVGGLLNGVLNPADLSSNNLLSPATGLVSGLPDTLDSLPLVGDLGLGDTLAPVTQVVGGLTHNLSEIVAPVLGAEFDADNANALDPVDHLVGDVSDLASGLLSPVTDALLGEGVLETGLAAVELQVDYITDSAYQLLSSVADGSLLPKVLGPDGLVDGLLGGNALGGGLLDGVIGQDGLVGGLLGGNALGGGLLDGVLGQDGLVGGLLGGNALGGGLLDGVLGQDGLVGGLLGGNALGGGLLDGVIGQDGLVGGLLGGNAVGGGLLDGVLGQGGLVGGLLGGLLGGNVLGGSLGNDVLLSPTGALLDATPALLDSMPLTGELGLGSTVAPVTELVSELSAGVSELTVPLLGGEFQVNNPNALDGVDHLVDQVTDVAGTLLAPVTDGLLGQGTLDGVLNVVDQQVDYLTDGVSHLLDGVLGGGLGGGLGNSGSLVGDLLGGGTQQVDLVSSLLAEDGLVGGVLDTVVGLGSGQSGASGLLSGEGLVGGVLNTVLGSDGLVGGLFSSISSNDNGGGNSDCGCSSPVHNLLGGLLG